MAQKLSFLTDPALPFHTQDFHRRRAIREGFDRSSWDTGRIRQAVVEAVEDLPELINVPDDFAILLVGREDLFYRALSKAFKGGVTAISEGHQAGLFSGYFKDLVLLDRKPDTTPGGNSLDNSFLVFTDLDPYTGKKYDLSTIRGTYALEGTAKIHCDCSFSVPVGVPDFEGCDSIFFNSRYGFGVLPGIGVWLARREIFTEVVEQLIEDVSARELTVADEDRWIIHGSTDPVQAYILGKVSGDMLNRGIKMIRNEEKYKAITIYNALKASHRFQPLIPDMRDQSDTIICATTDADDQELVEYLTLRGVEMHVIADEEGNTLIRIANYPAHSREQMEFLADLLIDF